MKKILKYITLLLILTFGIGYITLNADRSAYTVDLPEVELLTPAPQDTLPPRYPVAKTVPQAYQDLTKRQAADLKQPDNIQTTVQYDPKTNLYIIQSKLGDNLLVTPLSLTPQEYMDYSMQQSLKSYFRKRNEEYFQENDKKKFSLSDMQFDLGAAEKIFGPGGVQIKTQGTAEITMGIKRNSTQNPSLPARSRTRSFFNFDEKIQLNVQASVGDKVNFGMTYNTETTFDFDSKKIKLAYEGKEDEIIKSIEAGNVSMTTSNSLIQGGAALFGIKADLQFGKLRVNTIFSQQESESKTVSSKGGVQTHPFELPIDEYDENRHFFLGYYFRDNYDNAMSKLPYINSAVSINRIEVWVTNKRGNYDQARNIVAFSDLGEYKQISNPQFTPSGSVNLPYNNANTLYQTIVNSYPGARDINTVSQTLSGFIEGSVDYEKIESARKLTESEYTLNKQLGYLSLNTLLQADEVLAVAYEYTYKGNVYQVGEFASDNTQNTNSCLYLKLLKGTAMSPYMPFWDLMMKNIYSLGAYSVQKEKFRLDILYQSDTTGTAVNYISEGAIKDKLLIKVMNLDRLDSRNETNPDGFFDYVEGYTILSDNGKIIFPVVEPFGAHLRKQIGNDAIAEKYVFQQLYDSTQTVARQIAEKNKFILKGEYKASSSAEIQLGASNVARGSVRVTAGGVVLQENTDYSVDYASGTVTILNQNVISNGTPVSVSLENQSMYSMQRKTLVGLDLNYQFNKNFTAGATVMHLSEMPLTTKTVMGDESINNTLWGFNTSYKGESQWLTDMLDKIPMLNVTQPSQINFNAEFAHLIPGHYQNKYTGQFSYLDDFESTQSGYDLLNPYPWALASVPYDNTADALFPEAGLTNNIDYGKNRALLAWYYIDGIFTRKNSSATPSHIKRDKEQLSNHYVRAVYTRELFPNKDLEYTASSTLPVLNLAYYPNERGPYNLDADQVNPDGTLQNPEKRWGGIMRKMDQSDFEASNIEYIQFWVMDPFIYNKQSSGGDLYFNLGEISEDILKDEKKFFENGMPIDGNEDDVETTVWGKVPKRQSTVYAFDNTEGARQKQDVGLNGLSCEEELAFPTYVEFLTKLQTKLSPATLQQMLDDEFGLSPFKNPSGDKYHYFRGSDYDRHEVNILSRYKRYNGTEGNSTASEDSPERYDISSRTGPDVEDLNQDNTLNEFEKYYQYKVSIRPQDTIVGTNYIVDKRVSRVTLENGTTDDVTWYQFKVPIRDYQKQVGAIRDFKTIRFMRMFMTGFRDSTILRFGTFELVRGEWRPYTQDLSSPKMPPSINGTLDVSSVNIEENNDRKPVNYILPPGVSRMQDPGQPQMIQQNEQALSLKITNLAPLDARAVYKNTNYDLRQYKRLQMFVHAEKLINDVTELQNGELSIFIRLGSDYKNNYYEYEIPLRLTPHRSDYNTYVGTDQLAVWPKENMFDFSFDILTNLKLKRNRLKRMDHSNVTYQTPFSDYDSEHTLNKITIVGNPSLAEVKTIMIGVRNNYHTIKSGEIWVNELRLTDFNEDGGWAANANLNVTLSDLGSVNVGGRVETAGFGALDQSLSERRMDDYYQYNIAANVELGKFFPEKAQVSLPVYYNYSKEITSPKYNPLDQDILLSEALDNATTQQEKDSIKSFALDRITTKGISFNNVRVNIKSKNPMPYDPANFSVSYSYNENSRENPETEYETTKNYKGNFTYSYTPYVKPFQPFKNIKQSTSTRYLKEFALNYVPSNISFQTAMTRSYYEIQLRDLNIYSGQNNIPVSFSHDFLWDRAFSLNWNLTPNLNLTFSSGTNARIEEPNVQVNKKLNPDDYKVWKDSVKQSIADLGTPIKYDQTFMANYTAPLQLIPALNWINASASFNAIYTWDKGALVDDETEIGNTIKNQRQIDFTARMNMETLYNKSPFLKKVNQKFTSRRNVPTRLVRKPKKQRLEKEIQLSPDSTIRITHNLADKKVRVTAKGKDGKVYAIRFKAVNASQIEILNKDSARIRLVVTPGPPPEENFWYRAAEYSSRFLMMLRSINITYATTNGMMIPGFRPEIGAMLGQGGTGMGTAPGLGFAFGFQTGMDYLQRADRKDWLVKDENNITPAIMNNASNLTLLATLEPIAGLKINLNANRVDTRTTEVQYMYDGMPKTYGGNFTITTVAIRTAFGKTNANNGYQSAAFDAFVKNREIIASRLEHLYSQVNYPASGFLSNTAYAGQPYNPANGSVSPNSSDVLIPAFLAAYTGRSAKKISLSPFPSIARMLPNWRITYDGLNKVNFIKKYFKDVQLSHQYRCSYSVGTFASFLNWADAGDGLGFVRDVLTNNPTPSSPYDIAAVSITEGFSPLLGVDLTLLNNITGRTEYRTIRNLSLNMSSYQLVEAQTKEYTIGIGYKYIGFNKILRAKPKTDFSNDLTVKLDFSFRKMQSLIRKIEDQYTQPTSGTLSKVIQLSADYGLSKALTLRAFYDLQISQPLVSSVSFPTSNSNFGISLRFSLAQ